MADATQPADKTPPGKLKATLVVRADRPDALAAGIKAAGGRTGDLIRLLGVNPAAKSLVDEGMEKGCTYEITVSKD